MKKVFLIFLPMILSTICFAQSDGSEWQVGQRVRSACFDNRDGVLVIYPLEICWQGFIGENSVNTGLDYDFYVVAQIVNPTTGEIINLSLDNISFEEELIIQGNLSIESICFFLPLIYVEEYADINEYILQITIAENLSERSHIATVFDYSLCIR